MREIECTSMETITLMEPITFLMIFHAFWPLSQARLFPNSRGVGVGGKEVMQRYACESEISCVKLERAFFAGHVFF
jgi:hypothetical protein